METIKTFVTLFEKIKGTTPSSSLDIATKGYVDGKAANANDIGTILNGIAPISTISDTDKIPFSAGTTLKSITWQSFKNLLTGFYVTKPQTGEAIGKILSYIGTNTTAWIDPPTASTVDSTTIGSVLNALIPASEINNTDEFAFIVPSNISGSNGTLQTSTWSNIKSKLKTYFDTLYVATGGTANQLLMRNSDDTSNIWSNAIKFPVLQSYSENVGTITHTASGTLILNHDTVANCFYSAPSNDITGIIFSQSFAHTALVSTVNLVLQPSATISFALADANYIVLGAAVPSSLTSGKTYAFSFSTLGGNRPAIIVTWQESI